MFVLIGAGVFMCGMVIVIIMVCYCKSSEKGKLKKKKILYTSSPIKFKILPCFWLEKNIFELTYLNLKNVLHPLSNRVIYAFFDLCVMLR